MKNDHVWAFEWCPCIHESDFGVESLHTTLAGAYYAMNREANIRWHSNRNTALMYGNRSKYDPLVFEDWRVRKIEVES